jgi:hypothetical protein
MQRRQKQVRVHLQVATRHDVVERRHPLEERDVLEGTGDPLGGRVVGAHLLARLPLVGNLAVLGVIEPVDDVEHGALAGPVGTDDGADLLFPDVEADVLQRLHAAEGEAHVVHVEQHGAVGAFVIGHRAPLRQLALATGAVVGTSRRSRSALIVPVRPSSKVT